MRKRNLIGYALSLALLLTGGGFAAAQGMYPGWQPAYWGEPVSAPMGTAQPGYAQGAYPQAGYPQAGYPAMAYPQAMYPQMAMPNLSPVPQPAYIIPPPAPPQPVFQAPSPPRLIIVPPMYNVYEGYLPVIDPEEIVPGRAVKPATYLPPAQK